jgi:hypothetical protein
MLLNPEKYDFFVKDYGIKDVLLQRYIAQLSGTW